MRALIDIYDRGIMSLPMERETGLFASAASSAGVQVDHWTFELTRDLGTELEVLNWRSSRSAVGRQQSVYSIAQMTRLPKEEAPFSGDLAGCIAVVHCDSLVLFRNHEIAEQEFANSLWRIYLHMTHNVPRFPVPYPSLRDEVCEALRQSDKQFNQAILRLLREPQGLQVSTAGGPAGSLSYLAHMIKNLPPRTESGRYIMYLKLDRRREQPTSQ
jgi:hypothetical protein